MLYHRISKYFPSARALHRHVSKVLPTHTKHRRNQRTRKGKLNPHVRLFLASAAREEVKESCELILPQTESTAATFSASLGVTTSQQGTKPRSGGESGGIGKPRSALGVRRGSLLRYPAVRYFVISVSGGEKSRFLDGKKLRSGQRKAPHPQRRASQRRGRPLAQAPRRSPPGSGGPTGAASGQRRHLGGHVGSPVPSPQPAKTTRDRFLGKWFM